MGYDLKQLTELLKDKTKLLFHRERELMGFREMRDRIGLWLRAFHDLSLDRPETGPEQTLSTWASVMVGALKFQCGGAFLLDPSNKRADLICGEPKSKLPLSILLSDDAVSFIREYRDGCFEIDSPSILCDMAKASGLDKFHWMDFKCRSGAEYLLIAGYSALSAESHPITKSDRGHFGMFCNLLRARLDNFILISEVEKEREDLKNANTELDKSIKALRQMQEELIRSTRLASLGRAVGQTAHEVLNPITNIHGRLTRMIDTQDQAYTEHLLVFQKIVRIWTEAFQKGGASGLAEELCRKIDVSNRTFAEDDLEALKNLHVYFSKAGEEHSQGFKFLLREVDHVVHIVDGMRNLTKQSGTNTATQISAVLEESRDSLLDSLQKRNIELTVTGDENLYAKLDRYEFIQVLTNLIRNSMFAIEEKSGHDGGRIDISFEKNNDMIEIHIKDTGCGIPAEHIPLLFDSTFTSRTSKKGTGLGLGIARRLTRGFGGELSLLSTVPGQETVFLIEVPSAPPQTE